ncbi:MAG: tRNA 2-thiouridine(34) synthase MnmA [Thermoguttaceae bacterium]|nr:tRNA 2-thiouridine(34) synthase MnmA [Thermoguttaceae bacterium]
MRVVVAVSGGVDSSVAAWSMLQQGHEVHGVYLRHGVERWIHLGDKSTPMDLCTNSDVAKKKSADDAADAKRVADTLGFPLEIVDMSENFTAILQNFVEEYFAGRTPNPCVRCNPLVKFRTCFDVAERLNADCVVTGHYARILPSQTENGTYELHRAAFAGKDQSYVLHALPREWLARIRFPLGEFSDKNAVREIARQAGISTAEKRESQDICFLPDGDRTAFIQRLRSVQKYIAEQKNNTAPSVESIPESIQRWTSMPESIVGDILYTDGQKIGTHAGIESFTVGQRKGLAVACGLRKYIVSLDPVTGQVVLGDTDDLLCSGLIADHVNWLIEPPAQPFECLMKVRYRSPAVPVRVEPIQEKNSVQKNTTQFRAVFTQPYGPVAPGQYAVLYRGEQMIGGGRIITSEKSSSSS